jgi:hypothetical protein
MNAYETKQYTIQFTQKKGMGGLQLRDNCFAVVAGGVKNPCLP